MTQWKETIRNLLNLLIIACVIILLGFLGGFVSGILDFGETAGIIIRTAGLILLISLGMKLFSHFYTKPLTQEMKEEEIKEAEQKDEKQVVFKPSVGVSILFLIFISMSVISIIEYFTQPKADPGLTIAMTGVGVIFLWLWYTVPVLIFTEDSVQIKSHLFYILGINRKTVIRYVDISSVGPNLNGNYGWGVETKHSLMLSMNGITQGYTLYYFDDEIIAKIWLRFKEILGDKVKFEYKVKFE